MSSQKRILVAEDEPLISMLLEDYLDMLGFVIAGPVDSVRAGLDLIEGEAVDAAILDVHLNGEKVWPLAKLLRERGVPMILASGESADDQPREYLDVLRLSKPYGFDQVEYCLKHLFPDD